MYPPPPPEVLLKHSSTAGWAKYNCTVVEVVSIRALFDPLQTLYSVRAEILPATGEQQCRSGTLCGLEVCITRLTEPAEGELAEDSKTDSDGLRTTKLMYEGE